MDTAPALDDADRSEALGELAAAVAGASDPATVGQLAGTAHRVAGETARAGLADVAATVAAKLGRAREPAEVAALAQALGPVLPAGGEEAHQAARQVVAALGRTSKGLEVRELVRALAALPGPTDPVVARWVFWKVDTEAGVTRDPFRLGLRAKALALLPGTEADKRRPALAAAVADAAGELIAFQRAGKVRPG